MAEATTGPSTPTVRASWSAAIPPAVGTGVAIALGAYGRVHDPTGRSLPTGFFTGTASLKAWLTIGCLALATTQPLTGRMLHQARASRTGRSRLPPSWLGDLHRLIGTLTFGVSLPVAFHCLWSLGYQTPTTRVAVHSLIGCAFYGAFAAKVTTVRRDDQASWAAPAWGAVTFVLLVGLWWTGALWYLDHVSWSP